MRKWTTQIVLLLLSPAAAVALVDASAEEVYADVQEHLRRWREGTEDVHRRRVATTYGWGCGSAFPDFVDARTPTEAVHDEQLMLIDPASPAPPPDADRFAVFELEGRFTGTATIDGQSCARVVPRFFVERWCYVGPPRGCRREIDPAACATDPAWPRCRARARARRR